MKISLSSPNIAPHTKQNAMAYFEGKQLNKFYTTFYTHRHNKISIFFLRIPFLAKEINKRAFNDLPIEYFSSKPFLEIIRSISARNFNAWLTDIIWHYSELSFDKWVAGKIEKKDIDVIHTYEHCAYFTLQSAKKKGIYTIYEQLSQHHSFFTNIVNQQLTLYPELKTTGINLLINQKAVRRNHRRDEELKLADIILCNSSFTKRTLINAGIDEMKIKVIPLAFPKPTEKIKLRDEKGPIKFLYAGNQSLRKGLHLLYKAWKACDFKPQDAELWLIGKMELPEQLCNDLPGKIIIKNTIPHDELLKLYKEADVFVLPTLADGFGMVITESMSQGTPVITTDNSAGPDLIKHGKNGWIISAGDLAALETQMKSIVNESKNLNDISAAALATATQWQWADYRSLLRNTIQNLYQSS